MRRHLVQSLRRSFVSPTSILWACKLGFRTLWVRFFACDTLCPTSRFLPHKSHLFAITEEFYHDNQSYATAKDISSTHASRSASLAASHNTIVLSPTPGFVMVAQLTSSGSSALEGTTADVGFALRKPHFPPSQKTQPGVMTTVYATTQVTHSPSRVSGRSVKPRSPSPQLRVR